MKLKMILYWLVKTNRKYLKDVKAIPWELQHRLVVTDIDKRRLKKVVKKTIRRRVWKLKKNNMKARFQERVKKLADVDAPNLWNTFKIVSNKLLMKYVKRRKVGETMGIHGGGMKR